MSTSTERPSAAKSASQTERITGSEAVVRSLLAEGVDLLFGYPGGAIMPVYDELYKFQDQLDHVLVRHCLLYTSPSPRDKRQSRMPSSA